MTDTPSIPVTPARPPKLKKGRLCTACKQWKPLSSYDIKDYRKGKPVRRRKCRPCRRAHWKSATAANYPRYRAFMDWLKQLPCMDCNTQYPPYLMDFDHIPGQGEKHWSPSSLRYHAPDWETLQTELQKCQLVCANCHRKRTAQRAGYNTSDGL